mmetsp:Transcript_24889/g.56572  ORF Transcript_24889/g.56572 Transcript_24889/m.56572 type:complete len:90 (+) Transcript_24889:229-498(+)
MEPLPECARGVPLWPGCTPGCGLCGVGDWRGGGLRGKVGLVGSAIDCKKKLLFGLCTEKDWALPPASSAECSGVPQPASIERMWWAGKD